VAKLALYQVPEPYLLLASIRRSKLTKKAHTFAHHVLKCVSSSPKIRVVVILANYLVISIYVVSAGNNNYTFLAVALKLHKRVNKTDFSF
jgi:hypothetical protein